MSIAGEAMEEYYEDQVLPPYKQLLEATLALLKNLPLTEIKDRDDFENSEELERSIKRQLKQ